MSGIFGPLTSDKFAYDLCIEERFEALRPLSSEQVKDFAQDFSPSCRPAQTTARMVALQCLLEVTAARLQAELALKAVRDQEAERQQAELDALRAIADACEEDEPNPCADPFNSACECVHCESTCPACKGSGEISWVCSTCGGDTAILGSRSGPHCESCAGQGGGTATCSDCGGSGKTDSDPATESLEAMTASDVALSEAAREFEPAEAGEEPRKPATFLFGVRGD